MVQRGNDLSENLRNFDRDCVKFMKYPFGGVTIVFKENQKHIMELIELKDPRNPILNKDTLKADMEAGIPLRFCHGIHSWIDKQTGIFIICAKIQEVKRVEVRGEGSVIVYNVFTDSYGNILGFVNSKYIKQMVLE